MKDALRQSMSWLHTWAGLGLGWILYFMFLTGTTGYFNAEIDRWMQPERPLAAATVPVEQAIAVGLRRLQAVAPDAEQWYISLPNDRDTALRVLYRQRPDAQGQRTRGGNETLDLRSGEPASYRDTGGGDLLYRMHYALHYLPTGIAYWMVGVCTMFMLVAIISGVIVHKKIFKDFFTFRPGKQQRSWLDAHNVLSVAALPFHVMITYSGLLFFALTYMPLIVTANYGGGEQNRRAFISEAQGRSEPGSRAVDPEPAGVAAPLAALAPLLTQVARHWNPQQTSYIDIRNPGDANARIRVSRAAHSPIRGSQRLVFDGVSGQLLAVQQPYSNVPRAVNDVFLGLHEGRFAGPGLRWLYFFSGLLGTAMIGTGLVLWTRKRRTQQLKDGRFSFGLTLVERLNVGTLIGLPIGIAIYFWANRLIPAAFAGRAAWEINALFIAWALMLVHAHLRPLTQAWTEQLWIAAGLFGLLPLLNAATTERHLGITLPAGDWVLAGMDLTLLAAGLGFAAAALKVARKARRASTASKVPRPNPIVVSPAA